MSDPAPMPESVRSRRWLPVALTAAMIAALAVIIVVATAADPDPPSQPIAGSTELPVVHVIPPVSPSVSPSLAVTTPAGAVPTANPQPKPTGAKPTTGAPKPPSPTTAAPPRPSITTSAWGKCVWQEGSGWTIVVSVSVHNGSGTSASGSHGWDPNVGGSGTYSLSGGGSSFSGELPPNLGSNPELTGSVVSWSVTVRFSDGTTDSDSGSVSNPC